MSSEDWCWLEKPKSKEEIGTYLEKKFRFAGDNIWIKLLKASVHKVAERKLDVVGPQKVEDQTVKNK